MNLYIFDKGFDGLNFSGNFDLTENHNRYQITIYAKNLKVIHHPDTPNWNDNFKALGEFLTDYDIESIKLVYDNSDNPYVIYPAWRTDVDDINKKQHVMVTDDKIIINVRQ